MSAPESLFAEVAWNEDAFQMIGFDVIFYVSTLSLLSTYFAHKSKLTSAITILAFLHHRGISPQSCTETDFEMKTSNLVLFLLISVVSVHFRAIDDETIPCQA